MKLHHIPVRQQTPKPFLKPHGSSFSETAWLYHYRTPKINIDTLDTSSKGNHFKWEMSFSNHWFGYVLVFWGTITYNGSLWFWGSIWRRFGRCEQTPSFSWNLRVPTQPLVVANSLLGFISWGSWHWEGPPKILMNFLEGFERFKLAKNIGKLQAGAALLFGWPIASSIHQFPKVPTFDNSPIKNRSNETKKNQPPNLHVCIL